MAHNFETTIGYYDCDETGRLRISGVTRLMQRAAAEHAALLGQSYEDLLKAGMVYLLSKTSIQVHQMPQAGEKILVTTLASHTKGARFMRDVVIFDEKENRRVSILTAWMLVDPVSRKILRPSRLPVEFHFEESITNGVVEDNRLPKIGVEEPSLRAEVPICYSHIDQNGHLNNSFYLEFVSNLLPYQQLVKGGVKSADIVYQSEAVHGDLLTITRYPQGEDTFLFHGHKGEEPCFEALITLGGGSLKPKN